MLTPESLERYRRMTPWERFAETVRLIRAPTPWLFRGTPEQDERRFKLLERENELRYERMLTAIVRTRNSGDARDGSRSRGDDEVD